jgi:outer membrane protein insertion porin family
MIIFSKSVLVKKLLCKSTLNILIIFSLISAAFLVPQTVYAQQNKISSVEIIGNKRIATNTILSIADIYEGNIYSSSDINSALQKLKASKYFRTVTLSMKGNDLNIIVVENPTINSISLEGNKNLKDEDLYELIVSKERQTLSISDTEKDAESIASAYAVSGRISAQIIPKIIELSDNRVDLVFEIIEGRVTEIEKITFTGNRNFSDTRLRGVIVSKQAGLLRGLIQSDTYVEDRLEFDKELLSEFYENKGFIDFEVSASVELTRAKDAFLITFRILEGQRYKFGKISFLNSISGIDSGFFQKMNKIKEKSYYDPRKLIKLVEEIDNKLSKEGINFTEARTEISRNDENLLMDVDINLEKTNRLFVERIEVEGNSTTLDAVIRQKFDFVEGDPFDQRKVQRAMDRIRGLGFFKAVDTSTRQGSDPEKIIIDVNVIEKATGSLGLGAGYNSSDGSVFTFNINERNFLGKGQAINLALSSSKIEKELTIGIQEPSFLGRNLLLGISFGQKTSTPALTPLKIEKLFLAPKIRFPLSADSSLSAIYRFDQNDSKLTSSNVIASPLIKSDVGIKDKSAIILAYNLDKTNSVVTPTAGFNFNIKQEINGLGGDVDFTKTSFDLKSYKTFFRDDVIFSSNLSSGIIFGTDADITNRFFLGGDQLKGFRNQGIGPVDNSYSNSDINGDPLGGKMFTTINLETSFPIGIPEEYDVFGGVFIGAGSLWKLDNTDGGRVDDSSNIRAAAGVSLFWDTVIGPLRFNFSRPIKKETYDVIENFRFTVDTRF